MGSRSNPSADQATEHRPTLGAFLRGIQFPDLLVLLGFSALVIAGWRLHIAAGIAILGAGLILIGVRFGRS